ncbi:unnamed protein product [Brassica oleracea]
MANSFIILVDVKAKCCSNSAEVRFAECLKHQRKWKSVPSYTKSWYDRGLEIYQAEKYRKGARKSMSFSYFETLVILTDEKNRVFFCFELVFVSNFFRFFKLMSEEVSRESTCPHVSLIVCINVTYHCCVFVCTSRQCLRKWDALHWCKEARDCNGGRSML